MDISAEISDLKQLELEGLRRRWRAAFAKRPPENLPKHLLVATLTYDLQASEFGGLGVAQTRYLDALYKDGDRATLPAPGHPDSGQFRAGTVFAREHQGITHHVTVAQQGLIWNGNTYSSLSAVARAITGTNWNGRRFFGLPEDRRVRS